MTPVFADTSYFLALLGPADQHHKQAVAWSLALHRPLLTTEYIVLEVGNNLIRGTIAPCLSSSLRDLGPTDEWKSSRLQRTG